MFGLGIDTGGTYTDAVIYDFKTNDVICSSKSLTTKSELSIGIIKSIEKLDNSFFDKIELIALSTTLATNACVENRGGKAKLIFIGVDREVVRKVGKKYGLPPVDEIYFLDYKGKFNGDVITAPDFDKFENEISDFIYGLDAVGIVDIHAMNNNAVFEKKAHEIIKKKSDIPVICGNELFNDLNSVKRGSSVLLNAKLIPVICEFLTAIKESIKKFNITAPIVLVRSDGSLMSESFTTNRPVETLLCGPCASVMGGMILGGEIDSLIVDIGGTTTDVAIVRDSIPQKSIDGINIGSWRTYVKGIYVDTFGFGGDSAIRYDKNHNLKIDSKRVIPISETALRYPYILDKLNQYLCEDKIHTHPINEFYCLQKDIKERSLYTTDELVLYDKLKEGPIIYSEAAALVGRDVYRINFDRLEEEGIVIRSGFTPTDIMCINGEYDAYSSEAAKTTAVYMARCFGFTSSEEFCAYIFDKLKQKLYVNLLRILWQNQEGVDKNSAVSTDLLELFNLSWSRRKSIFMPFINTDLTLVGIGAPIHIFLPEVADKLGVKCVIPKYAGVANAVGAILGNVTVTCDVEIKPDFNASGVGCYTIYGKNKNYITREYEEAVVYAKKEADERIREEAYKRGAVGELNITLNVRDNNVKLKGNTEILLNTIITATAVGRIKAL